MNVCEAAGSLHTGETKHAQHSSAPMGRERTNPAPVLPVLLSLPLVGAEEEEGRLAAGRTRCMATTPTRTTSCRSSSWSGEESEMGMAVGGQGGACSSNPHTISLTTSPL